MISQINRFFLAPYPLIDPPSTWWKISSAFSLFVFLFLLIFQPFGLYQIQDNFPVIILGYALVCFAAMVFLNICIPKILPDFFSESSWTIGREVFWTMVNLSIIALGNMLYSYFLGWFPLSFFIAIKFILYVTAVGTFPLFAYTVLRQFKLQKEFTKRSDNINQTIHAHAGASGTESKTFPNNINIPSQNVNENFGVIISDLLFIRSADNYVEVFYVDKNKTGKKMIRNSIKNLAEVFESVPQLFRCHKSYMVNLDNVDRVSGNAQGLKLHLKNTQEVVPVSRTLTETIRNRFSSYP